MFLTEVLSPIYIHEIFKFETLSLIFIPVLVITSWDIVRQPNPDLGPYLVLRYLVFFLMDSVSLGIADDQTENWNFVSVEQFKI